MRNIKESKVLNRLMELWPESVISEIKFKERKVNNGFGKLITRTDCPLQETGFCGFAELPGGPDGIGSNCVR